MLVDLAGGASDWRAVYKLATGFINPRPIAIVSTVSPEGKPNLAPFSFYNMVSANPPVVMFCPSFRRDGRPKDTLVNVRATREFVVATATDVFAEAMNASSAELPYGENEFDFAGLTPAPALHVRPALVRESPVNIECRLHEVITLNEAPGGGSLVLGDVVAMHVADWVLDARGAVDPRRIRTLGRLGGSAYATTRDVFEMERP